MKTINELRNHIYVDDMNRDEEGNWIDYNELRELIIEHIKELRDNGSDDYEIATCEQHTINYLMQMFELKEVDFK